MVKLDATRNYYADLGVPANADENAIRKAFRQLALKCHPDRNPGREDEFVAKFQQIQAAHEVLSDPIQRNKYDNERKKYRNLSAPYNNPNTPRTRPPPPPRNSYTHSPGGGPGTYYRGPPPKPSPQRPPPPQQHYSNFPSGAERFTSKNFRAPPPTAQRPDPRPKDAEARANVFTAWQKMKQPRAEEGRAYNLNNPNGTPFGRSKSTRVPSSRKGFDPGTPGGDEGQARGSYRASYDRPDPSPPAHEEAMKGFRGHNAAEDIPFAEGTRVRTPYYSAAAGERTSMFGEGLGKSASVRNSPTHSHRPSPSGDAGFYSDSGHRPHRNSYGGHTKTQPFPHMYVSSDEEDVFPKETKTQRPPPPKESPEASRRAQGLFGTPQNPSSSSNSPPNPFKSRSEESINMKFSPSDWHGKFEGKPDYFAPNMQKGATTKGRTSPSRGRSSQRTTAERNILSGQSVPPPPPRASPFSPTRASQMPPPPPPNGQTAFSSGTNSAPHTAKFAPEFWGETFKEPSWAYPMQPKDTSPRRGSTATKRPNVARKPSAVPEASTANDSQADKSKPRYQAFAEDATNGDGDAMDIDSDTPPLERAKARPGSKRAPPKRSSRPKAPGTDTIPNGNAAANPSAAATKPPTAGLNGLSGLANVEPFLPTTNGGLGGLEDMKDQLPFNSQASSAHPTKPNTAQKLKYPTVPAAPKVPAKPDQLSAEAYFTYMEAYVRQYKAWNNEMMKHFISRDAELEDLDERFIHNRGETTKKIGFNSYLNKAKEDEGVLETWRVGQELHIKAMEQCQEVRNKMIKDLGGEEEEEGTLTEDLHPLQKAIFLAYGRQGRAPSKVAPKRVAEAIVPKADEAQKPQVFPSGVSVHMVPIKKRMATSKPQPLALIGKPRKIQKRFFG